MAKFRARTIRFAVPNEVAGLSTARDMLDRFGSEHGVPRESLVQLQVALDEVVSNSIKYAWPEGGSHEVSVSITARRNEVEVEISDDGQPFDPLGLAPPAPRLPNDKRKPGGVGIHMVRQLMDAIEYTRSKGRNQVVLTKRCTLRTQVEEE